MCGVVCERGCVVCVRGCEFICVRVVCEFICVRVVCEFICVRVVCELICVRTGCTTLMFAPDTTLPDTIPSPCATSPRITAGGGNTQKEGSRSTTCSRLITCWMAAVSLSPRWFGLADPDLQSQAKHTLLTKRWI